MPAKQLSQLHDSGGMISYHQFEEKILNQKNNPIKTSLILTTQTQQLFTIYKNTKKIIGERDFGTNFEMLAPKLMMYTVL